MQDSDGNAENVLISSKVSSRTTPVSIFYPSAEAMFFPRRECSVLTMHGEALRVQTATCPEVYWGRGEVGVLELHCGGIEQQVDAMPSGRPRQDRQMHIIIIQP